MTFIIKYFLLFILTELVWVKVTIWWPFYSSVLSFSAHQANQWQTNILTCSNAPTAGSNTKPTSAVDSNCITDYLIVRKYLSVFAVMRPTNCLNRFYFPTHDRNMRDYQLIQECEVKGLKLGVLSIWFWRVGLYLNKYVKAWLNISPLIKS